MHSSLFNEIQKNLDYNDGCVTVLGKQVFIVLVQWRMQFEVGECQVVSNSASQAKVVRLKMLYSDTAYMWPVYINDL